MCPAWASNGSASSATLPCPPMTAISIPPASHPFLGTSMGPNGRSGARRARSAAGHLPPRPTRGRSAPASAGRSRMLGGNGPARLADHGRLAKRGRASMDGTDSDQGALLTAPIGHMPAYGFAHVTALVAIVALSVPAVAWARRPDPGRVGRTGESARELVGPPAGIDRKSTRLNSSHVAISYALTCLRTKP